MLKKFLMILIMVIILMCAGCMTTYDLTHATTTKSVITKTTTKTNLKYSKRHNIKVVAQIPKQGNKKTIKAQKKIDCPCCGNGLSNDCVYYIHNEKRHMTETEIKSFDWLEYHYLADDGQWYELRTGNTEPVEKPDYVTNY